MRQHLAVKESPPKAVTMKPFAARGVHITSDDGQVDQATVRIRKSAQEEVTWFAHGAQTATIVFASRDGSPFQESVYHVPTGGSVSSGPIKGAAQYNKPYKYSVVGPGGVNDPEVIIDR
jgi:hypothetical protein